MITGINVHMKSGKIITLRSKDQTPKGFVDRLIEAINTPYKEATLTTPEQYREPNDILMDLQDMNGLSFVFFLGNVDFFEFVEFEEE